MGEHRSRSAGGRVARRRAGHRLASPAATSASAPRRSQSAGKRCIGRRQPKASTLMTASSTQARIRPTGTAATTSAPPAPARAPARAAPAAAASAPAPRPARAAAGASSRASAARSGSRSPRRQGQHVERAGDGEGPFEDLERERLERGLVDDVARRQAELLDAAPWRSALDGGRREAQAEAQPLGASDSAGRARPAATSTCPAGCRSRNRRPATGGPPAARQRQSGRRARGPRAGRAAR